MINDIDSIEEIFRKTKAGTSDKRFLINTAGKVLCYLNNVMGGTVLSTSAQTVKLNTWTHVACVYNGTNATIYVNGNYNTSKSASGNIADGSRSLYIGSSEGSDNFFNGTIDEFMLYNYSLSQEQLRALYEGRTDRIVPQETLIGDVWSDGLEDGAENCSNNLTVLAASPIPIVILQAPANDSILESETGSIDVSFTYKVIKQAGDIKNCTLLRNVYDGTFFSFKTDNTTAITETVNQSINLTFTTSDQAAFDWKVSCYGDNNVQGNSSAYKLTLSITLEEEEEEEGVIGDKPKADPDPDPDPDPEPPPPEPTPPEPPTPPVMNLDPGFSDLLKGLLDIPIDLRPRLIHIGILNETVIINIGNETEIEITDSILIKGLPTGNRPNKPTIWLRLLLLLLLILLLIALYYLYKKYKPKKKIKLTEYPTEEIDVYKINYLINRFNTLTKQIKQSIANDNLDQAQKQYQELLQVYKYLIIKLKKDREKLYNNIKQLHNLLRNAIKINYYKKSLKNDK